MIILIYSFAAAAVSCLIHTSLFKIPFDAAKDLSLTWCAYAFFLNLALFASVYLLSTTEDILFTLMLTKNFIFKALLVFAGGSIAFPAAFYIAARCFSLEIEVKRNK